MPASVSAALLLALAGCGGKDASTLPAAGGPIGDDPVAEMNTVKDAMCACETRGCLDAAGERMNAVSAKFAGRSISDEQADQIAAASAAIDGCIARVLSAPEDERRSTPDN